jgi:hypothetical protein
MFKSNYLDPSMVCVEWIERGTRLFNNTKTSFDLPHLDGTASFQVVWSGGWMATHMTSTAAFWPGRSEPD